VPYCPAVTEDIAIRSRLHYPIDSVLYGKSLLNVSRCQHVQSASVGLFSWGSRLAIESHQVQDQLNR